MLSAGICSVTLLSPPLANYAEGKLALFGLSLQVDVAELLVSVLDDILVEIVKSGGLLCHQVVIVAPED